MATYLSWHGLRPFAFLLAFKYFLDCLKYQGVGPFNYDVGLRMLHECECYLHSDLLTKVFEHCVVKVIYIVDYDVAGDAVMANDILSEKLFDGCRAYIYDRLRLNPLREVFHFRNDKCVIPPC
jgi:hypothetical protein